MPTSSGRILTSHAGSLPRPEDLIALNRQLTAGAALDGQQGATRIVHPRARDAVDTAP